jgi:hypothetical protein
MLLGIISLSIKQVAILNYFLERSLNPIACQEMIHISEEEEEENSLFSRRERASKSI